MSSGIVMAAYVCAAILPFVLLHYFGTRRWYWHVLSVCAALTLALTPMPVRWSGPGADLVIGVTCTFLFLWGVAAPLPHEKHHPHSRTS